MLTFFVSNLVMFLITGPMTLGVLLASLFLDQERDRVKSLLSALRILALLSLLAMLISWIGLESKLTRQRKLETTVSLTVSLRTNFSNT